MKQRLFDCIAVTAIALLILLLPDWFYSYRQSEIILLHGPAGNPLIIASGRGLLLFAVSNVPIVNSVPWSCELRSSAPTDPAGYFEDAVVNSDYHFGYRIVPVTPVVTLTGTPTVEPDAYGFSLIAGKCMLGIPGTFYGLASVPFWAVVPPLGWISFVWSKKKLLSRSRRRRGCCRNCGYDLRASPDRCPECGIPIL